MNLSHDLFVIAEVGVNHNGSVQIGKQLIDAAKDAGADAVKFQTFKAEDIATKRAKKADYQHGATPESESHLDMLRRLELSDHAHHTLVDHCNRHEITFLSSPFNEASADFLEELDVHLFKIPSGEVTNLPLLRHIACKGRPIILSTGMCNLGEVETALDSIFECGNRQVTLLHCVTEYPAPHDEINLRAMLTMKHAFGLPVGYSDHTEGIEVPIAAAALGARVIEKHLTLDRTMEGPDHRASIEPQEFQRMVSAMRHVQASLGDGIKRPATCELKNIDIARKSLVADAPIPKGDALTLSNITIKRPGHGISPADLDKALGRHTNRHLEVDEVVTWEVLS